MALFCKDEYDFETKMLETFSQFITENNWSPCISNIQRLLIKIILLNCTTMKLFLPDTTKKKELTTWNMDLLNPTLHGGALCPPPYQLWSLTAQTGRLILVQSSYKFGHMGTNYGQDPKNFSKCQQCLSYASCDEMIKNSPCKVGLRRTSLKQSDICNLNF